MAHPTRGHRSHTYDITAVHDVDLEELSITFSDAAHADRQAIRLKVEATPAARQLLEAMANSIAIHGDGQWESAAWLSGFSASVTRLLREMATNGVTDLTSLSLTLPDLRACIEPFHATTKRSLNKLVARALKVHHPNGSALATALQNTTYMVRESNVELYDDAEADAIEAAARAVLTKAFTAQRSLFETLGHSVTGRQWLRIPAAGVIDAAMARNPHLVDAAQPPASSPRIDLIDWAVLNPAHFGTFKGRSPTIGKTMKEIGAALYPSHAVLTAGAIIHCFAESSGVNLSVILRTAPDDLIYTGTTNGMLDTAKARSHSEDTVPVRTGSMFSLGGIVETLSGLTRFARHYRAVALATDDDVPEVANRIYVEHKRDPGKSEVITNQRLHHGWRQQSFDQHWPNPDLPREEVGLRFTALRRKVLERVIKIDPGGDVHGHTERTRVHYLQNILPEHTLVHHAGAALDDMHDTAVARFQHVDTSADPKAKELAAADNTADVILTTCISGGQDPDDATKPCSLGLAACFTCPNGYRTADNIPGLLATVELAEIIRDNDPDEWENGDAAALHFFATESLNQFPSTAVTAVRDKTDLTPHIINLTGLYTELRR